jgi:hypothetical protein
MYLTGSERQDRNPLLCLDTAGVTGFGCGRGSLFLSPKWSHFGICLSLRKNWSRRCRRASSRCSSVIASETAPGGPLPGPRLPEKVECRWVALTLVRHCRTVASDLPSANPPRTGGPASDGTFVQEGLCGGVVSAFTNVSSGHDRLGFYPATDVFWDGEKATVESEETE